MNTLGIYFPLFFSADNCFIVYFFVFFRIEKIEVIAIHPAMIIPITHHIFLIVAIQVLNTLTILVRKSDGQVVFSNRIIPLFAFLNAFISASTFPLSSCYLFIARKDIFIDPLTILRYADLVIAVR